MPASDEKPSFMTQIRGFPANFWVACFMEILERLAFFAVRAIAPLFLVASSGSNGLGLDYAQKGIIYMVWALLQCLIPMVSGGFTDRYGYRRSLGVAFTINILGWTTHPSCIRSSFPKTRSGRPWPGCAMAAPPRILHEKPCSTHDGVSVPQRGV